MMMAIAMLFGSISPAMATEYVYELTNEFTPGEEYLIVNQNTNGTGYALRHDGTSIKDDAVTIKQPGDVANNLYIDVSDVNNNSVWTVGNDYSLKNNDYYLYGNPWVSLVDLNPSGGDLNARKNNPQAWKWDSNNNRLYYNYKWVNYSFQNKNKNLYIKAKVENSGCTFELSEDTYSVYLYKKVPKKTKITVNPTELPFETITGIPTEKTFTVTGTNLQGDITATVTGTGFSIDPNPTTISKTDAESTNGKVITVTFNPETAGDNFSGTVTLTSLGAETVTVNLTGIAHAPKIEVDPATLTFETAPGTSITQTFIVTGTYLKGEITATVTTGSDKFSINANTISISDAQSTNGKKITVTFSSPNEASEYNGTITLTSDGATSVEVTLKGYSDGYPVVVNQFGVTTLYVNIPLAIPYDKYNGKLTGVFVATGVENNEVRLGRLTKGITANTGVMVTGVSGTYYFPKYRGGDLQEPAKNLLYGSTTDIARNDALTQNGKPNGIVMTLGRNANNIIGFYRYVGSTIRANSAFMIYEPTAGSNVTYFSLGGESGEDTDGISTLKLAKSDDAWYTLQGARLNGQPTQRGIYIHGGKKVAVK